METVKKIDIKKCEKQRDLKEPDSRTSYILIHILGLFLIVVATGVFLLLFWNALKENQKCDDIPFESVHEHNSSCPVTEAQSCLKLSEKYNWTESYFFGIKITPSLTADQDGTNLSPLPSTTIDLNCGPRNCTFPDWAREYAQIIVQQIPLRFLEFGLQNNKPGHFALGSFHLLEEDGVPKLIRQFIMMSNRTESVEKVGYQVRFASVSIKGQEIETEFDGARQAERGFVWNPFRTPLKMSWMQEEFEVRSKFVKLAALMSSLGVGKVVEKKTLDSNFQYDGLHRDVHSLFFFEDQGFATFQDKLANFVKDKKDRCNCMEQGTSSSTKLCWESWKLGQPRTHKIEEYCAYLKNLKIEKNKL